MVHLLHRLYGVDAPGFGAYWSQKVQLWWQQFLLIFLKNKCNFCTKTSVRRYHLYHWLPVARSNSSPGGALWGVFLLKQSPPLPYGNRRLVGFTTKAVSLFWHCQLGDMAHLSANTCPRFLELGIMCSDSKNRRLVKTTEWKRHFWREFCNKNTHANVMQTVTTTATTTPV